jgi:hypothetical protein
VRPNRSNNNNGTDASARTHVHLGQANLQSFQRRRRRRRDHGRSHGRSDDYLVELDLLMGNFDTAELGSSSCYWAT